MRPAFAFFSYLQSDSVEIEILVEPKGRVVPVSDDSLPWNLLQMASDEINDLLKISTESERSIGHLLLARLDREGVDFTALERGKGELAGRCIVALWPGVDDLELQFGKSFPSLRRSMICSII